MTTNETNDVTTPARKGIRGFRGHAIFFCCVFALGACVIVSHVQQWQIPMPNTAIEQSQPTPLVERAAVSNDETAAAL